MQTLSASLMHIARGLDMHAYTMTAKMLNVFLPPVIVLAYHRVTTLDRDPSLLAVSPDNFRQQIRCLSNIFSNIWRFDALWPSSKHPAVCLTFDDGYYDNYSEALPILEEFQIPATFFVSTGHVENNWWYWWDALAACDSLHLAPHIQGQAPPQQLQRVEALLREHDLPLTPSDAYRSLRVPELQEFAKHPLACIGAHTHTHPRLSLLNLDTQLQELQHSAQCLQRWTGEKTRVAAYPFGYRSPFGRKGDYNADSITACRHLGFARVAANYPSVVRPWTNSCAIPRYLVRNWDGKEFAAKINSFMTMGYF